LIKSNLIYDVIVHIAPASSTIDANGGIASSVSAPTPAATSDAASDKPKSDAPDGWLGDVLQCGVGVVHSLSGCVLDGLERSGCTTQGGYIGNGEPRATAVGTKHRGRPFGTTSARASTLGGHKRVDYGTIEKASRLSKVKRPLFKDASIVGTKDDNNDDGNDNDNDFVVERCK